MHPDSTILSSDRRAATDGIVVVEIGTEQREYHVHKALLTHHSEYFRRALSGSWKEAQEGVIPLHDIDPATCTSSHQSHHMSL